MSIVSASKGLAITNPLVLYRSLLVTKQIAPDESQHRLAIHLQTLYERLKDYEPALNYKHRLDDIRNNISESVQDDSPTTKAKTNVGNGRTAIWQRLLPEENYKSQTMAITRLLTSHEEAKQINSPQGLMLHGEVGTGKSMLVDLFAECLPNQKKKRWHFNTFMLHILGQLRQLQTNQNRNQDYSMFVIAKELIEKSPILFLDEFQLPDRASSKIITNLMTAFFQLGGVLVATSNRMPEELHRAAGVTYSNPPTRLESLRWKMGLGDKSKSQQIFAGNAEFVEFLDILKARCEVWEMQSRKDYRRQEKPSDSRNIIQGQSFSGSDITNGHVESSGDTSTSEDLEIQLPRFYHVLTKDDGKSSIDHAVSILQSCNVIVQENNWSPIDLIVYGRKLTIPRAIDGFSLWTFEELCVASLGPADYLSIASRFHTLILVDVPILTHVRRNEARRFITLLDALYESRCKLFILANTDPDNLFFPDQHLQQKTSQDLINSDPLHSETIAEAYQDATSPFRPNILSSNPLFEEYNHQSSIDYTHARLQGSLASDSLEDDPPNRRIQDRPPIDPDSYPPSLQRESNVNFSNTGVFTGEDEKFAYKRAQSRIWEMCSEKWWAREGDEWHRPLSEDVRRWERKTIHDGNNHRIEGVVGQACDVDVNDELGTRYATSPFRTSSDPPPVFSWTHVWGMMKWGQKAGSWGQGVDGLKDRRK